MSPPYTHELHVPPSAIDDNGHVNNVEYVRWMQDAAVAHFAAVGGAPILRSINATWVVRSHHIEYLRPARAGDRILLRTWVEDFRRVMSLRKYEFLRPADNTTLARGQTEWVLIDAATARPRSIPDDLRAIFLPAP